MSSLKVSTQRVVLLDTLARFQPQQPSATNGSNPNRTQDTVDEGDESFSYYDVLRDEETECR